MLFGQSPIKLVLYNTSGSAYITFEPSVSAGVMTPIFDDDISEQKCQDGKLYRYNRGWWPKFEIDMPVIADDDFRDLIDIMKHQYDYHTTGDQKFVMLTARTDYGETFKGYIVTPISILNRYHFLTNGARFTFIGSERLIPTQFLMGEYALAPLNPEASIAIEYSQMFVQWTKNPAEPLATGFVVVRKQNSYPSGSLQNGVAYSVGNSVLGGTVRYVGTSQSFTDSSGLSFGYDAYYKIIPYWGSLPHVRYGAEAQCSQEMA